MRRFRLVIWLLSALTVIAVPIAATAQILSITIAPPELPIYEQPEIPAAGYIWAPGYWAYGPEGYFWVPGTWVLPPAVGLLWTPGYWGWRDGYYGWNTGYWGPHVGFYGGVNYGYGYGGSGYEGGRWNNGVFAYNRTVNNFGGVSITNVYSQTVINNTTITRTSFNGGAGGIVAQPTPQEQAVAHEQHVAATEVQAQHEHLASGNKALLLSENHGRPAIAATSKPAEFSGKGVVPAREQTPGPTTPPVATPPGAKAVETNKPVETNKLPGASTPVGNKPPENSLERNRLNNPAQAKPAPITTKSAAPARPTRPAAATVPAPRKAPPHGPVHPVAAARPAPPRPQAPPRAAAPRLAPHPVAAARPAP
ncbi:MAG: YXWGXW repeat-containing protein, partial [Beijerinckiaceae bacterium]|nr:YXWGXW repeat-containing protein [Beijerinckiaceae bacterium]